MKKSNIKLENFKNGYVVNKNQIYNKISNDNKSNIYKDKVKVKTKISFKKMR